MRELERTYNRSQGDLRKWTCVGNQECLCEVINRWKFLQYLLGNNQLHLSEYNAFAFLQASNNCIVINFLQFIYNNHFCQFQASAQFSWQEICFILLKKKDKKHPITLCTQTRCPYLIHSHFSQVAHMLFLLQT